MSGTSTEKTNADVAAEYSKAADAFDAAQAPKDAPQWSVLGEVIKKYETEWLALPGDGVAIESVEVVESTVDAFASSKGFDNNNYDDPTPIFGAACAAKIQELSGQ